MSSIIKKELKTYSSHMAVRGKICKDILMQMAVHKKINKPCQATHSLSTEALFHGVPEGKNSLLCLQLKWSMLQLHMQPRKLNGFTNYLASYSPTSLIFL